MQILITNYKNMKKVIEILELEKSTLNDLIKYKVADEADYQIIAEIDQALQLLQSRVSSCCDMSVCMKLPKCANHCEVCNSVQ